MLARNVITTTGSTINVFTGMPAGAADITIIGNQLRASDPVLAADGIGLDLRGAGTVRADLFSNVIFEMSGCGCGNASGIEIGASGSVVATVNVVNNTIDKKASPTFGQSLLVRPASDAAELIVNVCNNLITRSSLALRLPSLGSAQLAVNLGFNTLFDAPPDYGAYSMGPGTTMEDPRYVSGDGGNHRLAGGSPAADTGTNTPPGGLPPFDADGNVRLFGSQVDRGAYERGAPPTITTTSTSTTSTTMTTLPPSCPTGPTFGAIDCRLDELVASVEGGVASKRFRRKLGRLLSKVRRKRQRAEATTKAGKARRQLVKAAVSLRRFAKGSGRARVSK